jgi:Mg2+-importing ATPase
MVTFGLVSSAFDYLTFGVLMLALRAKESTFQTGWFLESALTELLILLVIRTQRPFFKSRPGRALLIAVFIVAAVTVLLPYSPLSQVLGFVRLPPAPVLALLGIAVLYVLGSELVKKVFYARAQR